MIKGFITFEIYFNLFDGYKKILNYTLFLNEILTSKNFEKKKKKFQNFLKKKIQNILEYIYDLIFLKFPNANEIKIDKNEVNQLKIQNKKKSRSS